MPTSVWHETIAMPLANVAVDRYIVAQSLYK